MIRRLHIGIVLALLVCVAGEAYAQNLLLNPNRLVFEGRERKSTVLVNNPSDEPQTYRISLVKKRMLDDGRYEDVEEPLEGENYADKMIRFSPRSFTLPPKSSQTVRVQVRKKRNTEPGEYRSHMRVSVVPKTEEPSIPSEDRVRIAIQVHYGITIPIIVRHGDLSFDVAVDSIALSEDTENDAYVVKTTLTRKGDRSVYGDISVVFEDRDGNSQLVKFMPGLSIFVPNDKRHFNIIIPKADIDNLNLANGTLKVLYNMKEKDGGLLMAEGSLDI